MTWQAWSAGSYVRVKKTGLNKLVFYAHTFGVNEQFEVGPNA